MSSKDTDVKKSDRALTESDITISNSKLIVADGVEIIPAGTITDNKLIDEIVLPDSVKIIYEDKALYKVRMNLPSEYLKTHEKLPDKFTSRLLINPWRKQAVLDDYAALYMYQGGRCLKELSLCELKWSPNESAEAMIRVLNNSGRSKDCTKAAEFVYAYHTEIQNDNIQKMYDMAKSMKAKKAIGILAPIIGKGLHGKAKKKKEIEIYCHEHFSEYGLSRLTLAASSSEWEGCVKYKNSEEIAPGYVVQCAVAPYINMVMNNDAFRKCEEADHVAMALDRKTLIAALDDRNAGVIWMYTYNGVAAFCRYADEEAIKRLISQINKGRLDKSEQKSAEYAVTALILSDTRAAQSFYEKEGRLTKYNHFHEENPSHLEEW